MKKCSDCNIDMIDNAEIYGQHPFEIGIDGSSELYVSFVNGKTMTKNIFGKENEEDNLCENELKARVCPKCGKVELYIELDSNNDLDDN